MRRFLFASTVLLFGLLLVAPLELRADGFDSFTFTDVATDGSFSLVMTWQLPSSPAPVDSSPSEYFALVATDVHRVLNGIDLGQVPDIFYFVNPAIGDPLSSFQFFDLYGVSLWGSPNPMYSGPESAPTFNAGTYSGLDLYNYDESGAPGNATLSIVSTPEPSSILTLLVGFMAIAGALLAKKAIA